MLVFAFDRDWTIDVNPHPRHDAVPLEWVRHLAHETPHAVYAIGNQTLGRGPQFRVSSTSSVATPTTGTSGSARNSLTVGTNSFRSGASVYHSSTTCTRMRTATSSSTTLI